MLIEKDDCCLLIFNMQKEFIPTLRGSQTLIDSCCWLADLTQHFDIPVIIVDHSKLGEPLGSLRRLAKNGTVAEITTFSCLQDPKLSTLLEKTGKRQFLLSGAESHITILQSAVDFKKQNKSCFVIGDAVSSRSDSDHNLAMQRFLLLDIPVISKEMLFFELLRNSTYPNYMNMSIKFLDNRYIRE